ncbi:MAG: TetR/AcrR family transcriptional regulator [Gammaproteobacteria bacterium]
MVIKRNPDKTREAILVAAFEEIHAQGFRSASIDNILRRTGVTKGALYHHFPNKTALGYAVVEDVIAPWAEEMMADLDDENLNPLDTLQRIGKEQSELDTQGTPMLGCPVSNLIHEMSALDEGFRRRLNNIMEIWRSRIGRALRRGQEQRLVRMDINADNAAAFTLAAYEGCIGMAKSAHNTDLFEACLHGMVDFVNSLRAQDPEPTSAVA